MTCRTEVVLYQLCIERDAVPRRAVRGFFPRGAACFATVFFDPGATFFAAAVGFFAADVGFFPTATAFFLAGVDFFTWDERAFPAPWPPVLPLRPSVSDLGATALKLSRIHSDSSSTGATSPGAKRAVTQPLLPRP